MTRIEKRDKQSERHVQREPHIFDSEISEIACLSGLAGCQARRIRMYPRHEREKRDHRNSAPMHLLVSDDAENLIRDSPFMGVAFPLRMTKQSTRT